MSAPERKFEYKRLSEAGAIGFSGTLPKLGAEGWRLMDISPSSREYLFMREVPKKSPRLWLLNDVFSSRF